MHLDDSFNKKKLSRVKFEIPMEKFWKNLSAFSLKFNIFKSLILIQNLTQNLVWYETE